MATAFAGPTSFTAGVYASTGFPDGAIRAALDASLCFWHEDLDALVADCRATPPDLLLACVRRPDARTLGRVGEMLTHSDEIPVVLVCERSGASEVRKALDAGVRGLVSLGDVESALLPVIEVVRAGQVSVPDARARDLGQQVLTVREKQILGLVVMGMTNAEIAAQLFLAESTVKSHLSSAFAKLGVASRNEAAALILDPDTRVGLGILTIPSQKFAPAD